MEISNNKDIVDEILVQFPQLCEEYNEWMTIFEDDPVPMMH